jgi:hypothetical protein
MEVKLPDTLEIEHKSLVSENPANKSTEVA